MIKIETKYEIGQEVFFMNHNRIECEKVLTIEISKNSSEILIYYILECHGYNSDTDEWDSPQFEKHTQNSLYASLDDLLNYLKMDCQRRYCL